MLASSMAVERPLAASRNCRCCCCCCCCCAMTALPLLLRCRMAMLGMARLNVVDGGPPLLDAALDAMLTMPSDGTAAPCCCFDSGGSGAAGSDVVAAVAAGTGLMAGGKAGLLGGMELVDARLMEGGGT